MQDEGKVLVLLVSLYKEVIDTKAKVMGVLHKLEPSFPEHLAFSHEYRSAVSDEIRKAAAALKALGFSGTTWTCTS